MDTPSPAPSPGPFAIGRLGEARHASPLPPEFWVPDGARVVHETDAGRLQAAAAGGGGIASFEKAGPRERLFFDPAAVTAGVVTCGGLCPGLNDVIRALTFGLWTNYGVKKIVGFRFGYEGLVERLGHEPLALDPEVVDDIHQRGGTMLGASRGPQDPGEMVDRLAKVGIDMLFAIGGDGTQRGALAIAAEVRRRGLPIAVVGVPKTIDNDIVLIDRSFGFETAVGLARGAIQAAHTEARDYPFAVGIVKLMGRESGFVAAYSALANSEVDVCLVPEVPVVFDGSHGLLAFLERRLRRRRHAVIVVAEGACQDLIGGDTGTDASGNRKLKDVGPFLADAIGKHCGKVGIPAQIKYVDPSYMIRSMRADADDSVYCLELGHHAVHAAMAGKTAMIVGSWANEFTHVPVSAIAGRRKRIDPDGMLWQTVVQAIGQPERFGAPLGFQRRTMGLALPDSVRDLGK
ncbi:MAG: ATP-dependent 6-phosphofructokinase [Deltaproteobacteria bacterium]|nr:ATP-dependent 6-phosphofructokinase [Deltaproteobacteria bacterium]